MALFPSLFSLSILAHRHSGVGRRRSGRGGGGLSFHLPLSQAIRFNRNTTWFVTIFAIVQAPHFTIYAILINSCAFCIYRIYMPCARKTLHVASVFHIFPQLNTNLCDCIGSYVSGLANSFPIHFVSLAIIIRY